MTQRSDSAPAPRPEQIDRHGARALERAHDGERTIAFSEDAYEIRVAWRR